MLAWPTAPWGKVRFVDDKRPEDGIAAWHPLVDHCLDVAACFRLLLSVPTYRRLVEASLECALDEAVIQRLMVIVFLHDIGKLIGSFQSKVFPAALRHPLAPSGHAAEAVALLRDEALFQQFMKALPVEAMFAWFRVGAKDIREGAKDTSRMLVASWSHHGRPVPVDGPNRGTQAWKMPWRWARIDDSLNLFGEAITQHFPAAFGRGPAMRVTPEFEALFCGLLSLADWIGSDDRWFPYTREDDTQPRLEFALESARKALAEMGVAPDDYRACLADRPLDFNSIFDIKESPRPTQRSVMDLNISQLLAGTATGSTVLLEGETGSGKTEAMLWYGFGLYLAGLVDGIYIALPTRTSGVQMHGRVLKAVRNAFGKANAPPVLLAIPGYMQVDDTHGAMLGDWKVRWDEDKTADTASRGWAAENPKRYLAAPIAVGTIDQALMSVIAVKHAHMRAACLQRSLLVIDEIHASDDYMTELGTELVRRHVAAGGHVFLMSATLGAEVATRYVGGSKKISLSEASTLPYPLIRHRLGQGSPVLTEPGQHGRQKNIEMALVPEIADDEAVARLAARHAQQGAKVLVIRNTVAGCIGVRKALADMLPPAQQFSCNGVAAPHHGRFAAEDRKLLDVGVQREFGKERPGGGMVLVATQTVEQSLDIDADILITDICPMDVLLQRLGRLHRHERDNRPDGYQAARCLVLVPPDGLLPLTKKAMFGIGRERAYQDVRIVELTRRLIEAKPLFRIPEMNRELVEATVHSEAKKQMDNEDTTWSTHGQNVSGKSCGERQTAHGNTLVINKHFGTPEQICGWMDGGQASTRLGVSAVTVRFDPASQPRSPFGGRTIPLLNIPHWMAPKAVGVKEITPTLLSQSDAGFRFSAGGNVYVYDADGLRKE